MASKEAYTRCTRANTPGALSDVLVVQKRTQEMSVVEKTAMLKRG